MTVLTRHTMPKAMDSLQNGLFYHNVDKWSLLSKLDRAEDRAAKSEVKQSDIKQFFCAEQGQKSGNGIHHKNS